MQQQVAAPDVDDERDGRSGRGDIGEVLFGPHAEIRASGLNARAKLRDDLEEGLFVRDQVVGRNVPSGSDSSYVMFQKSASLWAAGASDARATAIHVTATARSADSAVPRRVRTSSMRRKSGACWGANGRRSPPEPVV